MSRFGGARHSSDDLAYGAEPNRWDRDRFERFRREPEQRETIRITERDTPRRTDVRIEERERETRKAPGRFRDEREFEFLEEERYGPPARIIPRRSDRDLFGDEDPREIAERSLAPYRRKSIVEREIDINRGPARPGMIRRQSSLDTFDRRPIRREREEYRIPPNVPIPLPRRRSPSRARQSEYDEFEDIHYRDYTPQGYRDVEITRERSKSKVRRRRDRAKSDLRSISTRSSSSSESFEKVSRHSSPSPERKVGKKGKTRMPKRLVRKEAVIELRYPFEEEVREHRTCIFWCTFTDSLSQDDFIIVGRALEKEQIDEVIRISENYKGPSTFIFPHLRQPPCFLMSNNTFTETTTYRFEETLEAPAPPPPPAAEHYETLRTEWINPPSVRGAPSVRAPSPARSSRTRRSSPARTVRQPSPARTVRQASPAPIYIQQPAPPPVREQIYIQQPAPPPVRETIYYQQQAPQPPQPPQQPMTIVLPERHRHSDRDVQAEIRALEAERTALRYERYDQQNKMVLRQHPEEAYEVVEFRERRPERYHGGEMVEYVERREKSPKRETIRVEKDRKGRMALVRSSH